jgi:hypothetical protein
LRPKPLACLPDTALALLHARSEGWAAGLRLAALSLAGHLDPEQFAAEFSGSERTVAGYLMAEVLELDQGSPQEAEHYLAHAARRLEDRDRPVPPERRARLQVLLSIARLQLAQERVDPQAVAAEANLLLGSAGTAAGDLSVVDLDLRALAVINLGNAETWPGREKEQADRRLERE